MTKANYKTNEDKFNLIGLNAFFNTDEDKNINWYDFFQLSDDEQFCAVNNNHIIEENKTEEPI